MFQSPVKICVFFTYGVALVDWDKGGMLDRELAVYRTLLSSGVEVTLWTYDDTINVSLRERLGSIKVMPVGSLGSGRVWPFIRSLYLPFLHRRALKRFDLFKSNQLWGAWVPCLASILTGRRWILREGYEYFQFARKMGKSRVKLWGIYLISWVLYRMSSVNVVTSAGIRDFALDTFSLSRNRFRIISNYVDTDCFRPVSGTLPGKAERLVFVGRLSEQKNLDVLVEAAAKARIGVDIYGEGELKEQLREQAQIIGADLAFMGVLPNSVLPGALCSYLAFVLPSKFEGVPKTLLEAMACGCTVIGSRVEGIQEFIEDGRTGWLAEPNTASFAAIFSEIKVKGRNVALGANGRRYIEENHSLEKIVKEEMKLYKELLNEEVP